MPWTTYISGLAFSSAFVFSCFTNKFVLSVLKFTYPTLFQGSAALSWLPASLLFVGNIYAGSRALSRLDIPFFYTLQNSSHVVSYIILKVVHKEKMQRLKFISVCLMLLSAISLPVYDPQLDHSGYLWAIGHLLCIGAYRVSRVHYKSINLSDLEQQCLNYLCSVLLLAFAAHPTGDLLGVLEFPLLQSHTFHCGCCASALLQFLLLLATVKLKSGLSFEYFGVWTLLSKVTTMSLSPFIFNMVTNAPSLICVVVSHVGEALLVYAERETQL
uniref:transmembrane protein 241 isoform X2 n=1 Tax=Monopterus albus TaxID=43700 RepID=UPI0009B41B0F|nr:transmembrane protein 241 isoform X2 [Monopterus albus]